MEGNHIVSGKVVTFYSYKGGSGRTLALANVASFLAKRGEKDNSILVIDWDLDSPGLHRYFHPYMVENRLSESEGLIELFEILASRIENSSDNGVFREEIGSIFEDITLDNFTTSVKFIFPNKDEYFIDFMPSGKLDNNYGEKIRRFVWDKLWDRAPNIFSAFAQYLSERYDWVLIDSRTGFTLTSYICAMLMPSRLVVAFTPNNQSLEGIKDLTYRAAWARSQNREDFRPLEIFPLPSRVEASEETLRRIWRFGSPTGDIEGFQPQFEKFFQDIYELNESECSLDAYFNEVQVQHTPRYAYGEEISALVEKPDRFSLARSFQTFVNIFCDNQHPWEVSDADTGKTSPDVAAIEAHSGLSSSLRKSCDWLGAMIAISKAAKKLRQVEQLGNNVPVSIRKRTIDRFSNLLEETREKNRLQGHGDDIFALDIISDNGKILIASVSQDHTVKLWRSDGYEEDSFYQSPPNSKKKVKLCDVAISPDASRIGVVSNLGILELIGKNGVRIFSTKIYDQQDAKKSLQYGLCFTSDGKNILTNSPHDKNLQILNLKGDCIKKIRHRSAIYGIDFNPKKQLIASVETDLCLNIWDLNGKLILGPFSDKEASQKIDFLDVSFDHAGDRVAVSCSDSTVRIWNLNTKSEQPSLKIPKKNKERAFSVFSSSFSPSGKYLATACEDGIVRVWDLEHTSKVLLKFEGHNDQVRAVKFLSEELILSGGGDNSLRIWQLHNNDQSSAQGKQEDLSMLLDRASNWLADYLRTNRNLDISDRYIFSDL